MTGQLIPLLKVALLLSEPDYRTRQRAQRGEFAVQLIRGRYYVTQATFEAIAEAHEKQSANAAR